MRSSGWNSDSMGGGPSPGPGLPCLASAPSRPSPSDVSSLKAGGLEGEVILREGAASPGLLLAISVGMEPSGASFLVASGTG